MIHLNFSKTLLKLIKCQGKNCFCVPKRCYRYPAWSSQGLRLFTWISIDGNASGPGDVVVLVVRRNNNNICQGRVASRVVIILWYISYLTDYIILWCASNSYLYSSKTRTFNDCIYIELYPSLWIKCYIYYSK